MRFLIDKDRDFQEFFIQVLFYLFDKPICIQTDKIWKVFKQTIYITATSGKEA